MNPLISDFSLPLILQNKWDEMAVLHIQSQYPAISFSSAGVIVYSKQTAPCLNINSILFLERVDFFPAHPSKPVENEENQYDKTFLGSLCIFKK